MAGAPRTWPFRFEIMDGLRGLAALAVVAHHLGIAALGREAVMVFFVISGYCITASAESCRRKGMPLAAFMWRRLHRIYPPYFFAIGFYALTRIGKLSIGAHNDLQRPWTDWLQNLTLTQWVSLTLHPAADAVQNPKLLVGAFWSLCYEEQFYLVVALGLLAAVSRRIPMIAVILALSVVALAWNLAFPAGYVTGVFIEYWAHFSLGAILFYVLCVHAGRAARGAFVGAVAALCLYCTCHVLPWFPALELARRVYVELAVASGFALFLFLVRPFSAWIARRYLWRPISALGLISYSLYLIHQFNLTLVRATVTVIAPHLWEPARLAAMLVLFVLIATAFWYCCERPFLNRAVPERSARGGAKLSATARPIAEHLRTVPRPQ
jgi:peptidoglycan/LPS O-acetylase OafA/YrhL